MIDVVRRACELVGGPARLAQIVGVKRQAFYQWPEVPSRRVLAIEGATDGKITRHELRPDLYPASARPSEAAA